MEFRRDDRGVTVQIGAVLLFGILIIALATMQVTVVPDENEATEFQHSLDVQESIGELRNALLAAGRSGDPAATSVPLGTTYEQRTFFVNPPPARGTIRTVGTGETWANVSLTNARADSPYPNANAYWNGTTRTYDTGSIVYTPSYTRYQDAPTTVYEHSLVANVYSENRTLERTGQTLIRGTRINLLTINGTLSQNGVTSESIDARPLSAYTNTVSVRSTASDPLWINITSRLTADTWQNRVLAEQTTSNGGKVAEVAEIENVTRGGVTYHRIGIKLAPGSYELRGSSVAVGAVAEQNKQPEPTYLVVTDDYDQVGNGSTGAVTVQVRDQFNNPVDGVEVAASVTNNGDEEYLRLLDADENGDNGSVVTGEDGYATVTYKGVNETGTGESASLNVSMPGESAEYTYRNFSSKRVPVFSTGGSSGERGGNDINPGSAGDIILTDANIGGDTDLVRLTFNNTNAESVNATFGRIDFYYTDDNNFGYTEAAIADGGYNTTFPADPAAVMQIGGDYERFSGKIELPAGESDVTMEFRPKSGGQVERDELYVVTVVFEINGETEVKRYFVNPR